MFNKAKKNSMTLGDFHPFKVHFGILGREDCPLRGPAGEAVGRRSRGATWVKLGGFK